MKRLTPLLLVLLAGTVAPATASAGTLTIREASDGSVYVLGDETNNVVSVTNSNPYAGTGVDVVPGPGEVVVLPDDNTGCQPPDQGVVHCPTGNRVDVHGMDGNDTLQLSGVLGARSFNVVYGDRGDDAIHGSDVYDVIFPGTGNDTVDGGDGSDLLSYGDLDQPVSITADGVANEGPAGESDSVTSVAAFEGSRAGDTLIGGPGSDEFHGNGGNDTITGDGGYDVLYGDAGDDQLDGGDLSDGLQGGDGNDTVLGGPGNDSYGSGGEGNDLLDGGPGDDRFAGEPGADEYRGGDGIDSVAYGGYDANGKPLAEVVSLNDAADDGAAGEGDNVRTDVEDVTTGLGDDTVTGSSAANVISTGDGNDTVNPGGGADRVLLGIGDDAVDAQDGAADALSCGDGADRATADRELDTVWLCETLTLNAFTPPDTVKPKPTVVVASGLTAREIAKGIPVTLSADEPAAFEVVLTGRAKRPPRISKAGDYVLTSRSLPLAPGSRKIRLKLSKRNFRALRRRARLTLTVTATDAAGNVATVRKSVRVK